MCTSVKREKDGRGIEEERKAGRERRKRERERECVEN